MPEGYFHRLNAQSATRFWINNPTVSEAKKAIAAGAISCTTNPAYVSKLLQKDESRTSVQEAIEPVIQTIPDDQVAADLVQRKLVKLIMDLFLPLYVNNQGKAGFVSIQGNPFMDEDTDHIIKEAIEYKKLGKNFIAKIPVTRSGLEAMEVLIAEDIPIIATEVMALDQAVTVCELYLRVSKGSSRNPLFFLTHITGIFDEYLQMVVQKQKINISRENLIQAGCIVARKQYQLFKKRGYPGIMLGGGAREIYHFTEMVGSEMHITINWAGTADKIIEKDLPIINRMDTPAPQYVVDELSEKLTDFRKAYNEGSIAIPEFKDFGPVSLFRDSFIKGWSCLLQMIQESRKEIK